MQKRWIQLGIVGKAHGLNGAFFVSQRDEELPEELKKIRIGASPDLAKDYVIKAMRWQNDRPVLQCDEIKSREAAEAICHSPVWADRDDLEIDEDEEYFWSDLVGKTVNDSEGKFFGTIKDVYNYGASDIVLIDDGQGRSAEIPFVEVYFDMDFDVETETLKLLVPAEIFDEAWSGES